MVDDSENHEREFSDAELVEILKNHGLHRRSLVKGLGAGAFFAAVGGTASAQTETATPQPEDGAEKPIDQYFGATYAADESVPSGLADHEVSLEVADTSGDNDNPIEGFPADPESDAGEELPAEFLFDPVGLHVNPGQVVQFTVVNELHTVTSMDPKYSEEEIPLPRRVPTDYAFTSPPVVDGDSWLYRFTESGVYDLVCLPHVVLGMVMRIVVSPGDSVPDDPYGPLEIPNAGDVLGADQLNPENIVNQGSIAWGDLDLKVVETPSATENPS